MPTPPILVDVRRNGRTIPAVFLTGKMGLVFIFDRVTGEPLYGMEERPVAASEEPAEASWPTQPFPLKPGPLGRVGMTRDDVNRTTPEIEAYCTDFWDRNGLIPSDLYWRPTSRGPQVTFPSNVGGPNWGPLSYDPELGYVFVNLHNTGAYTPALTPEGTPDAGPGRGGRGRGRGRGGGTGPGAGTGAANRTGPFAFRLPSGEEVPCYAPPYGELVAVDVNRGEIAWRTTLGINPFLAELGDAGIRSGARNIGGSIATASGLVFIAATNDRRFRAFDARTGEELWATELPASGHSTPVTYMGRDGRQYVVIGAGGGTNVGSGLPLSDALVAFRLP
jgi:quinoprotein glucose dehydrogenase